MRWPPPSNGSSWGRPPEPALLPPDLPIDVTLVLGSVLYLGSGNMMMATLANLLYGAEIWRHRSGRALKL